MNKRIENIKTKLKSVFQKYPIQKVGLFGSVLGDDFKSTSDIDLLVEFSKEHNLSLFDLFDIKGEIQSKVGRKVDLVQYSHIKPALRTFILPTEVRIYEK